MPTWREMGLRIAVVTAAGARATRNQPAIAAADDDRKLGQWDGPREGGDGRGRGEQPPRPVRCQRPRHLEDRLRHHCDRCDLEAVDPAGLRDVHGARQQREGDQRRCGRERESEPRRESAGHPGAERSDRDAELAAGRAWERLAQRHQVAERRLVEPRPAFHVFPPEVPDMGDRTTERGEPQPQGSREDLDDRSRSSRLSGRRRRQEASSRAAANWLWYRSA